MQCASHKPVVKPGPRFLSRGRWSKRLVEVFAASAVLVATGAQAQTAGPVSAASASLAASQPADGAVGSLDSVPPPGQARPPPRYSVTNIERAFNFMDANKDGQLSRQEAAGFRQVAKYFDAADTDRDGMMSLAEFGSAMNRP